jgi:NAD(P)H-flavin reductase
MSMVKKYKSEVVDIINPVDHIYTVSFRCAEKKYKYDPGQFLHLALDEYDGSGQWPDSRCFSMQSSPEDEFIKISYSVKGNFTSRMAKELKTGKEVWVKLPYGDLFTREHALKKSVFIAGGTGITPYLSLFTSRQWFEKYESPILYSGYANAQANIYLVEMEKARNINLSFQVFNRYEDKEGRLDINEIFARNGTETSYFISGPPVMIKIFKLALIENGVIASNILTDDWE